MTIFNIILIIYSPISKIENKLNIFCSNVLSQMKTIYDKINNQIKTDLINTNNDENKNKTELNIKNNENININGETNFDKPLFKLKKNISTFKSIKNKKGIKISNFIRGINQNNFSLNSTNRLKIEKSNNSLNNIRTMNLDSIELNDKEKNEKKIVDELMKNNDSEFYIFYIIKNIPYKRRKKFLSESEIKDLSYKNALKIENRNKSKYYFALLNEKNKIISICLNDKDYNIKTIKMSVFIFNFNLSLTINALFFDDEAIYEINQDEGSFNLGTQISRIIYSAIISAIISFIVELLAFTHNSIIKLRYYKNINKVEENIPKLIKILKIKIILFFGTIILLDIIFLYYITAFCAIYSIIQIHMISDSLLSFLLTMSYSIIFSLISANIRIFSLKKESKIRHFLYILSWIISLI